LQKDHKTAATGVGRPGAQCPNLLHRSGLRQRKRARFRPLLPVQNAFADSWKLTDLEVFERRPELPRTPEPEVASGKLRINDVAASWQHQICVL
jgi:hypothetical protein